MWNLDACMCCTERRSLCSRELATDKPSIGLLSWVLKSNRLYLLFFGFYKRWTCKLRRTKVQASVTSRLSSLHLHSPKVVRRHRRISCYAIGCAVLRHKQINQWDSSHSYWTTGSWVKMRDTAWFRVCVMSNSSVVNNSELSELCDSVRYIDLRRRVTRVYTYATYQCTSIYSLQSTSIYKVITTERSLLASKWLCFYDRYIGFKNVVTHGRDAFAV